MEKYNLRDSRNSVNAATRLKFTVSGRVQGVGFRPFIWRLAQKLGLSGFCRNCAQGVEIEAQGATQDLLRFEHGIRRNPPPLAEIIKVRKETLAPAERETGFRILTSQASPGADILVSPDIAICPDCLADIRDPENRRFGYAFTNCTNCGPRFSITADLPYDRASTCMACFAMCQHCAAEYADPGDRRFHAQPIACPECGPSAWFVDPAARARGETRCSEINSRNALARAAAQIAAGAMVAIRGLGGFQLACDATNAETVARLRLRKQRPHKAFAVMAPDIKAAAKICNLTAAQANLLNGPRKPIVLCEPKPGLPCRALIAPDSPWLGIMLPYTPLHALLLDALAKMIDDPVLVMTSANPAGEPICLGNREALDRLGQLADAWLLHNRDILCRVDDSVCATGPEGPLLIRRSRGYVPEPVKLAAGGPNVFGAGSQLKAAFCITRGAYAFTGQHIGDLDTPACLDFYEEAYAHLLKLTGAEPELVACDLHPDFAATRFAQELARSRNLPVVKVQHHLAHAAACLGENRCEEPALALCLDGSGLGTDGAIWGGELLLVDPQKAEWQRLGSLSEFALPGGEAAIRQPWRITAALKRELDLPPQKREEPIYQMLANNINCSRTSSAGRLFDAVAALLGLCDAITYEGQAAIRLEQAATAWLAQHSDKIGKQGTALGIAQHEGGLLRLDGLALFKKCLALMQDGAETGMIAAFFHRELATGFASLAHMAHSRCGVANIALSGGVLQNQLFARLLAAELRKTGLVPLAQRQLPPGDGCIGAGQAIWAMWLANAGRV